MLYNLLGVNYINLFMYLSDNQVVEILSINKFVK